VAQGAELEGKDVVVSGSGNVAIYAMEKVEQFGGKVVACSDSSGYVYDPAGIDVGLVRQIKETERGRISDYAARRQNGSDFVPERPFGRWPAKWRFRAQLRTN